MLSLRELINTTNFKAQQLQIENYDGALIICDPGDTVGLPAHLLEQLVEVDEACKDIYLGKQIIKARVCQNEKGV